MPRECLKIIESKSKVCQTRAKAIVAKVSTSSSTPAISFEVSELKDMVRALLLDKKNQSSAPTSSSILALVKANPDERALFGGHPKQVAKKTWRPGKFLIPCEFLGMDECLALADLGASINLMPLFVWEGHSLLKLTLTCMTLELADRSVSKPIGIAKDVSLKVGVFHFPADFMVIDFKPDPRVPIILERCFLKTGRALIDVHKGELTLHIENEAITYNLDQTLRYSANYNQMTANKIDVIYEVYSQEVLGFLDTTASGNPTPYDDLIVSTTSPTLTLFGDSDFLLFEEADTFLTILSSEPLPPLPNHKQYLPLFKKELKVCEAKTVKSSVDEPTEVKLKDLPPHLEYAFLEGDNKLPVIISRELGDEEKSALIKGTNTIVFSMASSGIFKFPLTLVIRRKQRSPVLTKRLPIDACLSACAMHRARSKGTMEVFMDDFSVFGNSFENCLSCLDKMLQRCEDTNLTLNWEKSHFMVKEGIVLGHKISKNGIEVDKAKIDVIAKLPHPTTVKENLAADNLSRLENPYENVLDPKEINETFPLETLSMVTFCGDSNAPWEKFHNAMRCLKIPSTFVKSLMFGALTLWARFRLHEGTNIFSWPSTICQNGLKRKRFSRMTPELFANS
nr:reverse transcriptase domain-containing protein [Tanacetum cinerariifolium]